MVYIPTPFDGGPSYILPESGDPSIDALLSDSAWGPIGPLVPVQVSYSFPDAPFSAPAVWSPDPLYGYGVPGAPPPEGLGEPWDPAYRGLDFPEQQAFRDALVAWEEVALIDFVEVLDLPGFVGDIRVAWTGALDPGDAATGRYPGSYASAGDIWLSTTGLSTNFSKGGYSYLALLHEIGHAIGLKHSFEDDDTLPVAEDSRQYTVMSYTGHPGADTEPLTPMLYDVLAIQYVYGINFTTRAGPTVYDFAPQPAEVRTIWDGGGHDTFDLNNQMVGAVVDMNPGGFSSIGLQGSGIAAKNNIAIAFLVQIEDLIGSGFDDLVTGNVSDNHIWGREGDDTLFGGDGNDTLDGGPNDDSISGESGQDTLVGGDGNDTIAGGAEQDSLNGGNGVDTVDYTYITTGVVANLATGIVQGASYAESVTFFENIWTGSGNDRVTGTSGRNVIETNDGDDTVFAGNGNDTVHGGTGIDRLFGNMGEDRLYGESENDTLYGGDHNDTLSGGDDGDSVFGDAGNDWLEGDGGHDNIRGGVGRDTVEGGTGNDTVFGEADNDVLKGGGGEDEINGDAENDILEGEGGHDLLNGGDLNDTLSGGAGEDTLIGGLGDDRFFFAAADFTNGVFERDTIEDYDLDLAGVIDSFDTLELEPGSLAVSSTVVGNDLEIQFDGDGDIIVFVGITDATGIILV